MTTATVTSKGQVTIPQEIRAELEIEKGDKIIFKVENNTAIIQRVAPIDVPYYALIEQNLSVDWNAPENDVWDELELLS